MGINDILAAIDNMKRVGGRNIRDLGRDPIGALSKIAHNVKEQLTTPEGTKEFVYNSMAPGVGGIIKSKGGNWLTGSVENALERLRKTGPSEVYDALHDLHPDIARKVNFDPLPGEREVSVDDLAKMFPKEWQQALWKADPVGAWVEGPLTKYVKRDMATEGDPVRKLAERGILHFEPNDAFVPYGGAKSARRTHGYPTVGVAKSDLAKQWEAITDAGIGDKTTASRYLEGKLPTMIRTVEENPWLQRVGRNEAIYGQMLDGGAIARGNEFGFKHLTDELANALNPESGLPRHLQLTPEQMQQMGMEKAVRHVADINAWRAAQQAEANLAKSQSPAVHLVREYAENNPKGLRWVEIANPKELPEGWVMKQTGEKFHDLFDPTGRVVANDTPSKNLALAGRQHLADQLKYEGDMMGHCVGGYCDDVASGKSRIFSLRDAKGEPHVTIETGKVHQPDMQQWEWERDQLADMLGRRPTDEDMLRELNLTPPSKVAEGAELPSRIVQIKGKGNKAPKEDYLPFVQDFVRNHPEGGKWADVGDLGNTGLIPRSKMLFTAEEDLLYPGDYFTKEEYDKLKNFAKGGLVEADEDLQYPGFFSV